LLEQGFKVAICEQMADPSKVKGIVPREVVRVVSPGIAFDDAGLDARQNHYLVSIERADATDARGSAPFGLAALDLSTGELLACEASDGAGVLSEAVRLDPREVLLGPGARDLAAALGGLRGTRTAIRVLEESIDDAKAAFVLAAQLGAGEAERSCPSLPALRAAARCLAVARECEAGRPLPVARLVFYALGETLVLDEATQAHLELVRSADGTDRGSLLGQIDATKTAPGARLLRRRLLAPLASVPEIRRRHDAVELFVSHPGTRRELRDQLDEVGDVERLAIKLALDRASPRDLTALRRSLGALPTLAEVLARCPEPDAREALGLPVDGPWVDACDDLHDLLLRAVADEPPARASDGGVVRDGFDAALDEARDLMRGGQRLIVELEGRLRDSSGISSLKLRYTRVFGWYIEVTRAQVDKAPSSWRRKQTVATGERFTCDDLDALADKLAHAEESAASREAELFARLVRDLAAAQERLRAVAARLAGWDVASALAEVAHQGDWVRPELDDSLDLVLEDARHPVVEKLAAAGRYVPNDVSLGAGEGRPRLWLVTGPNMAGKSTLMRQTALCVILAQMGAFVPARTARVGIVDRVLTRVGASDNVSRGESTFMVEMKETAHVLRSATKRSLVVLDEIGRGTSTYDGLAIAWSVAEHLHDTIGCRAMFATHYHELTDVAVTRAGTCENWSVSAREHAGDVVFLHKLSPGPASRSYGVACARLAGLPEVVLARAKAMLAELEQGAALPSGAHASLRARTRAGRAQLDLFGSQQPEALPPNPAVETLKAVDVDRLTPLDALQLVATLKKMAGP
jgi:DNA mismatch repair protein MutS